MGARELYVEHRYKGRFIKAVRLDHHRRRYILGSGRGSDLRLAGEEISGVHAAFVRDKEGWKIVDLSGTGNITIAGRKFVEEELSEKIQINVGEHELVIHPKRVVTPLFSSKEDVDGTATHHEVVLIFKNRVEQSLFLSKGEPFKYVFDGKEISLKSPETKEWTITQYGDFEVRQRLVPMPSQLGRDSFEWDMDIVKSLGGTIALLFFLLLIVSIFKTPTDATKPQETRMTQMIFDAKIVQKKREKSAAVRTQVAPKNAQAPQVSNNRSAPAKVSTKVISDIKASGLSQLIGKIAVRAGNTKVAVQSNGSLATNNVGRGIVSGSTIKDKFDSSTSNGYKVAGVATGGKVGGTEGYQAGAVMAEGGVGTGEVGVIDEESVIDGGLDREVIAAIIKESLGQIRYCYERHLSANPDLNGKVQVRFTIGATGTVVTQAIGSSTLKNAMVEGCILRRVARWKFPEPKGGTSVIVTYPFLFKALN